MIRFWALVVFVQLGAQWLVADANVIKPSQRSSADDVTYIDQDRTIYQYRPGTYRYYDGQQLRTCELCEPGHYLIRHCDGENWRTCGLCPYNFYMPLYNNGDKCRSCGDICDGDLNLVTLQECSPTAPRRCACKPGTAQVHLGANGPGMCKPYETGKTTTVPKHDNVTSLQVSRHGETTEKTTTSVTNNTTTWDLDSSLANDTLSYDLAEIGPIVGPLAGLAGCMILVIIGAAWRIYASTSEKEEDFPDNKDIDLLAVFDYVADNVGNGWRRLARKLPGNIPTNSFLDGLEGKHHSGDLREMAYDMLLNWKQKNGDKASLKGLQQGLRASETVPLVPCLSCRGRRLASEIGKMKWPEMV